MKAHDGPKALSIDDRRRLAILLRAAAADDYVRICDDWADESAQRFIEGRSQWRRAVEERFRALAT